MLRSLLVSAILLLSGVSRADVAPRLTQTFYLAVDRSSLGAKQAAAVGKAFVAALRTLPGKASAKIVGPGADGRPRVSAALSRKSAARARAALAALRPPGASAAAQMRASNARALLVYAAAKDWSGHSVAPRHHMVLISGSAAAPSHTLKLAVRAAVYRGFTVSFAVLGKLPAKLRRQLAQLGAGRSYRVKRRGLRRALTRELRWTRLTRKQTRAQRRARAALGRLKGPRGASLGPLLGLGAPRKKTRRYVTKRFHRSEAVLGKRYALVFRNVRCRRRCDVAQVRRQLRRRARPLLACLERRFKLPANDVARVEVGERPTTPAEKCVARWWQRLRRRDLRVAVVVGEAGAVR